MVRVGDGHRRVGRVGRHGEAGLCLAALVGEVLFEHRDRGRAVARVDGEGDRGLLVARRAGRRGHRVVALGDVRADAQAAVIETDLVGDRAGRDAAEGHRDPLARGEGFRLTEEALEVDGDVGGLVKGDSRAGGGVVHRDGHGEGCIRVTAGFADRRREAVNRGLHIGRGELDRLCGRVNHKAAGRVVEVCRQRFEGEVRRDIQRQGLLARLVGIVGLRDVRRDLPDLLGRAHHEGDVRFGGLIGPRVVAGRGDLRMDRIGRALGAALVDHDGFSIAAEVDLSGVVGRRQLDRRTGQAFRRRQREVLPRAVRRLDRVRGDRAAVQQDGQLLPLIRNGDNDPEGGVLHAGLARRRVEGVLPDLGVAVHIEGAVIGPPADARRERGGRDGNRRAIDRDRISGAGLLVGVGEGEVIDRELVAVVDHRNRDLEAAFLVARHIRDGDRVGFVADGFGRAVVQRARVGVEAHGRARIGRLDLIGDDLRVLDGLRTLEAVGIRRRHPGEVERGLLRDLHGEVQRGLGKEIVLRNRDREGGAAGRGGAGGVDARGGRVDVRAAARVLFDHRLGIEIGVVRLEIEQEGFPFRCGDRLPVREVRPLAAVAAQLVLEGCGGFRRRGQDVDRDLEVERLVAVKRRRRVIDERDIGLLGGAVDGDRAVPVGHDARDGRGPVGDCDRRARRLDLDRIGLAVRILAGQVVDRRGRGVGRQGRAVIVEDRFRPVGIGVFRRTAPGHRPDRDRVVDLRAAPDVPDRCERLVVGGVVAAPVGARVHTVVSGAFDGLPRGGQLSGFIVVGEGNHGGRQSGGRVFVDRRDRRAVVVAGGLRDDGNRVARLDLGGEDRRRGLRGMLDQRAVHKQVVAFRVRDRIPRGADPLDFLIRRELRLEGEGGAAHVEGILLGDNDRQRLDRLLIDAVKVSGRGYGDRKGIGSGLHIRRDFDRDAIRGTDHVLVGLVVRGDCDAGGPSGLPDRDGILLRSSQGARLEGIGDAVAADRFAVDQDGQFLERVGLIGLEALFGRIRVEERPLLRQRAEPDREPAAGRKPGQIVLAAAAGILDERLLHRLAVLGGRVAGRVRNGLEEEARLPVRGGAADRSGELDVVQRRPGNRQGLGLGDGGFRVAAALGRERLHREGSVLLNRREAAGVTRANAQLGAGRIGFHLQFAAGVKLVVGGAFHRVPADCDRAARLVGRIDRQTEAGDDRLRELALIHGGHVDNRLGRAVVRAARVVHLDGVGLAGYGRLGEGEGDRGIDLADRPSVGRVHRHPVGGDVHAGGDGDRLTGFHLDVIDAPVVDRRADGRLGRRLPRVAVDGDRRVVEGGRVGRHLHLQGDGGRLIVFLRRLEGE